MIKKLKWKFVLILMLVVTLLLAMVFTAVYFAAKESASQTAVEVLQRSLSGINNGLTPYFDPQSNQVLHFTVSISSTGQVTRLSGNMSVGDDLLLSACAACLAQNTDQGVLENLGLRYLMIATPGEIRIAFADMSFENSILTGLNRGLIAGGAAALALFFGLSVLLSSLAVKPIQQAWDKQKQFVADASHELNTPLTVISSNLELLSESNALDENGRTQIERVRAESDRMKQLTGELLGLARAENTSQKVKHSPICVSEIAMRESLLFEPLLYESGLGFEYRIEKDLWALADEAQITQIVSILIDNARKYAAPGTAVTLTLAPCGKRTGELKVRNLGQPMTKEQLENIFERFYRADDSRASSGYGLGLAIARALAQSNHCTLRASSSENEGTVFTLTFPTTVHKNGPNKRA